MRKVRSRAVVAVMGVLMLLVAACSSGGHSSASPGTTTSGSKGTSTSGTKGSSGSPITIGFYGDLTGVSSSTFADGPAGAMARVDLQNAQGGVDGHKLKLDVEDDA